MPANPIDSSRKEISLTVRDVRNPTEAIESPSPATPDCALWRGFTVLAVKLDLHPPASRTGIVVRVARQTHSDSLRLPVGVAIEVLDRTVRPIVIGQNANVGRLQAQLPQGLVRFAAP